jgi:NAD(P)-dependent dehydrogenase (short-subunit alcohol dehydrogenase family)
MYLDRFNLKGRVAVVTGGGQGIGLACVEALSEAGAHVYIADRNLKAAKEAQGAMKAMGYAGDVIEMEVTDSKQVDSAAARVMTEKGRVDILVCNAGIARSETPAEDVTDEHWLNVIDVNLNGLFWCCRAFGRHMLAAGRGSIINMSSAASTIRGAPNRFVYGATKAGVIGLTKSVAIDFVARGIRCNCICPGTVETPSMLQRAAAAGPGGREMFVARQPMGRLGTAEEIAALAVYLASDESAFTTGVAHVIDGGWTL